MRHRHHTIALVLILGLAVVSPGIRGEVPATRPTVSGVPIVFSSDLDSRRLSDAQQREIGITIAEAKSKAGQPWFVYVHGTGEKTYRVTVYFKPVRTSGRVWYGWSVFMDSIVSVEQQRQISKRLGGDWPAAESYAMLVTGRPGSLPLPNEQDLPFLSPKGLSDEELVKAVQVARDAAVHDNRNAAKMPIRSVEDGPDGAIQVQFGWQSGGLSGHGTFVELRRDGTNFVASGVGVWVS